MKHLLNFFTFIRDKRGYKAPLEFKLLNNLPISEEDLEIDGNFSIHNKSITSLPPGLKVSGHLNLTYTRIPFLPHNMEVGRSLYLNSSKIKILPADLKVGKNIYVQNTPLSSKYSPDQIRARSPGIKGKIVNY